MTKKYNQLLFVISFNAVFDTNLGKACSFDEVIEFAQSCISWQRLNVHKEILLFGLEQLPVIRDQKGLGPE